MFGWRRRKDGFEWREYVRTTILLRRKKRQEKLDAARQAAADRLRKAADEGVKAGSKGAEAAMRGSKAAGSWLGANVADWSQKGWAGVKFAAVAGAGAIKKAGEGVARGGGQAGRAGVDRAGSAFRASAGWGGRMAARSARGLGNGFAKAGAASAPLFSMAGRQGIRIPLLVIAIAAGLGAGLKAYAGNFDAVAWTATLMGAMAGALALGPTFASGVGRLNSAMTGGASAALSKIAPSSKFAGGAALILALVAGVAAAGYGISQVPFTALAGKFGGMMPEIPTFSAPEETLRGRAKVLSGDTIEIAGKTVMLAGIEAPERRQICARPGARSWRCGVAATSELTRLVRRKTVACETESTDAAGRRTSTCRVGETDLAQAMVEGGHVFATAGLFPRYGQAEATAREAKAGVWRGTPQRPSDYRAERWQKASAGAPDGCPIKGRALRSRGKVYLLPWSSSYDRFRVRQTRGDRWFCSEDEALREGWQPYENS